MEERPIIALDFSNWEEAKLFLQSFHNEKLFIKVGMELFYQSGPTIVETIKSQGHHLFLDLKLHDIPNTVYQALKGLAALQIDMVNVHAAGGKNMMKAAIEGLDAGTPAGMQRPLLIAVTQLTSTTEEQMQKEQLISKTLQKSVVHYARLTYEAGLDGVVCSALEAAHICRETNEQFLRVAPGIRLAGEAVHDQKRVVTPENARKLGATGIVVGRSITEAASPLAAYMKIKEAWKEKQQYA